MRAAARHFTRVAYQIITAFDDQPSAVDEAVGNFMTRVPVHVVRRVGGLEGQRRGFAH